MVILELDLNICKERLMNRRLSACTGSVTNVAEDPESLTNKKLHLHPKDRRGPVEAELTYYCEHYGAIRNYCGGTATVVNANQSIRWVYENVCAILTRGSPACPPRQPCIVKEDKEWDALTGTCSSSTSTVTVWKWSRSKLFLLEKNKEIQLLLYLLVLCRVVTLFETLKMW